MNASAIPTPVSSSSRRAETTGNKNEGIWVKVMHEYQPRRGNKGPHAHNWSFGMLRAPLPRRMHQFRSIPLTPTPDVMLCVVLLTPREGLCHAAPEAWRWVLPWKRLLRRWNRCLFALRDLFKGRRGTCFLLCTAVARVRIYDNGSAGDINKILSSLEVQYKKGWVRKAMAAFW